MTALEVAPSHQRKTVMHRAIETRYKGRRFRSRLEARYAVLFDALDIVWDYEPEGFELGGGLRYLPDFFTSFLPGELTAKYPNAGYWVEIKPEAPTEVEKRKLALLAEQTGHIGYLFAGPIQRAQVWYVYPESGEVKKGGPEIKESAPINCCSPKFGKGWYRAWDTALTQALSARFEFGENGGRA